MKRSQPLRTDPAKARAWQQRSAQRAAARAREKVPQKRSRNVKTRRSDGPWRDECIALYGDWCRACGRIGTQMDHMHPKSQGGARDDVRNGLPLCRSHHEDKTAGRLKIRPEWLTPDQREYLAESGWVKWDEGGHPHGEGWKHFEPWQWATT